MEKLGPIDSIKRWIAIYLLNRVIDNPVKGVAFPKDHISGVAL